MDAVDHYWHTRDDIEYDLRNDLFGKWWTLPDF